MKKLRRLATAGTGFTFLVVGTTGVIFQFWFKSRPLLAIHAWLGVAMFSLALVHILQNWRSLLGHLRDWRVYALLVPPLVALGYFSLQSRGKGRAGFDDHGFNGQRREGANMRLPRDNPRPSGVQDNAREIVSRLAASPADRLAGAFGKDANRILASMKADGLQADPHKTVLELAQQNRRPPEEILIYFTR